MEKKGKNGVILFDNSTIQNLYLAPEVFPSSTSTAKGVF